MKQWILTFYLFIRCTMMNSQHVHPAVDFDYLNYCFGSTTLFYNTTLSNTPATYTWSVYQQGNSVPIYTVATLNMTYQFPAKDTYTVMLCADNGGGHKDCMQDVVVMDSIMHADFQYMDCDSKFSSFSTCATSHKWDFGDGNFSTVKNPTHYFSNTGIHTVKLVVSNGTQFDSITKSVFTYTNVVSGAFTYKHLTNDSVFFMAHDTLLGGNVTYHWMFGDGTEKEISSFPGQKVKHKYPAIKKDTTYLATLHVEIFCNEWETSQSILIVDSVLATSTTLFPNPSNGILHLETERKIELTAIKLYNSIGQEITNLILTDKLRGYDIDISSLAKGPYILKLFFGNKEVKNYKIIVP